MELVSALVLLFLAYYAATYLLERWQRPGHWPLPVIGSLVHITLTWDTWLQQQLECKAKFGKLWVMRVPGFSVVNTAHMCDVEYVLKTNFDAFPKGAKFREIMFDLLGDGIFCVDHDPWRAQRKAASYEFSVRRFREHMSQAIVSHLDPLTQRLDAAVASGEVVDLQAVFAAFTLDTIGEIAFGYDLGTLQGRNAEFSFEFDQTQALILQRFMDPLWRLKRRFNLGREARLRHGIEVVKGVSADIIAKRRAEFTDAQLAEKGDLLSRFLVLGKGDTSTSYVMNFMLAGRDTTSASLSWTMWSLHENPEVLARLREELRAHEAQGGGTGFDGVRRLHYLAAVCTETLRLYPSVPVDAKVAEETCQLPSGHMVYKGEWLTLCFWLMGRDTDLWGADAEKYDPSRFLNAETGEFEAPNQFKFPAFNAGPRLCLGQNMAYLEMKMALLRIVPRYDWALAGPRERVMADHTVTLRLKYGLPMQLTRREEETE